MWAVACHRARTTQLVWGKGATPIAIVLWAAPTPTPQQRPVGWVCVWVWVSPALAAGAGAVERLGACLDPASRLHLGGRPCRVGGPGVWAVRPAGAPQAFGVCAREGRRVVHAPALGALEPAGGRARGQWGQQPRLLRQRCYSGRRPLAQGLSVLRSRKRGCSLCGRRAAASPGTARKTGRMPWVGHADPTHPAGQLGTGQPQAPRSAQGANWAPPPSALGPAPCSSGSSREQSPVLPEPGPGLDPGLPEARRLLMAQDA